MIKTLTFNINFPFTGKTKATITVAFCIFVPLNPSKTSFQNDIQPSCFKFGDSKNGMQILRRHMRVKDGRQNNGRQRYKCKSCHRKQQALYSYNAYQKGINDEIVALTKEGVGIRSTARILNISPTTLLSRIVQIARRFPLLHKHQPDSKQNRQRGSCNDDCRRNFFRGMKPLKYIFPMQLLSEFLPDSNKHL